VSIQSNRLYINEVATRDGFQIEPIFIPTDDKVALINHLSKCGFAKIEATSFTSPKAIPMLRDADEVMGRIQRMQGVEYTVLVPNLRGAERAVEARADELNLVMSVSESHNNANLKMTREQSFTQLSQVIKAMHAIETDSRPHINVSLSTSFGCPMQGNVEQSAVLDWCARYSDLGIRGITLCDTTGMAYPSQVSAMAEAFTSRFFGTQLTMHFHNTRGMGLANVLAAARGLPALLGHDVPSQLIKAGPRLNKVAATLTQH
jgi:hydroxymethylglutaryl-CoA lyase